MLCTVRQAAECHPPVGRGTGKRVGGMLSFIFLTIDYDSLFSRHEYTCGKIIACGIFFSGHSLIFLKALKRPSFFGPFFLFFTSFSSSFFCLDLSFSYFTPFFFFLPSLFTSLFACHYSFGFLPSSFLFFYFSFFHFYLCFNFLFAFFPLLLSLDFLPSPFLNFLLSFLPLLPSFSFYFPLPSFLPSPFFNFALFPSLHFLSSFLFLSYFCKGPGMLLISAY